MPSSTMPPPRAGWAGFIERRVPALAMLRGYSLADLRGDLVAGASVAAVAVPQAMAYALIVGVAPEHGLYTAIVMTIVGALFASSRQLINGPTNAISIALFSAVGAIASPGDRAETAILMALMVGAIQLVVAFVRAGDLTRYISHSVIVGFTAGASVLLVLDQLKNLLGLTAQGGAHDHFLVRFWQTMTEGGAPSVPTVAVGAGSIVAVLALRWIKGKLRWPLLPEFLLVVVGAAVVVAVLGLDRQGVKVIGDIPAHLPAPHLPAFDLDRLRDLGTSALAIALLGLLEAISMSKALAAMTHQRLDLNQQCLSEGFANLAGGFFQCFPGSGSLTRSAVNHQAGARTPWSGVVSAVAVAATMLLFAPYARYIPRSALAGLLVLTAARMVSLRDLRYHVRVSRFDAVIVAATAVAAVAISIEFCVLVGVFLSFMLAVPRAGQVLLTEFVVTPEGAIHERLDEDTVCGHLLIFGLEGEMFFGAATSLETHFDAIEARVTDATRVVVLRMKRARNPDAVGMALFEAFVDRLRARKVRVIVCGVRHAMNDVFRRSGLAARLEEKQIFLEQPVRQTSTLLAIAHACTLLSEPCPHCPRPPNGALSYAH